MEALPFAGGDHPTSVIRLEFPAELWREPVHFGDVLASVAVLHNRVLALRRFKEGITPGQLLHPVTYLAPDERLTVKSFLAEGQPCELYAFPAVARTVAELLREVAAATPGPVPFRVLISLFKNELELLTRRRYREDDVRRLFKLAEIGAAFARVRVALDESGGGEKAA